MKPRSRPAEAIAIYQQFPENPGAQERLGELLLSVRSSRRCHRSLPGRDREIAHRGQSRGAGRPRISRTRNRTKRCRWWSRFSPPIRTISNCGCCTAAFFAISASSRRPPQDFWRATKIKPDSAEAWSELAGVLVMAEDYPAALAALDRLAALHAEKPAMFSAGHRFG